MKLQVQTSPCHPLAHNSCNPDREEIRLYLKNIPTKQKRIRRCVPPSPTKKNHDASRLGPAKAAAAAAATTS